MKSPDTPIGERPKPKASIGRRVQPEAPVGRVETHTYQKSGFGAYYHRGFFSPSTIDNHIERMLADGWEPLTTTSTPTPNYGLATGIVAATLLGPLGLVAGKGANKETTVTINFIKKRLVRSAPVLT